MRREVYASFELTLKDKLHKIRTKIIKETLAIVHQKDKVHHDLMNHSRMDNELTERLTFQALLPHAQNGKKNITSELLEMNTILKHSFASLPWFKINEPLTKEIHVLATDKPKVLFIVGKIKNQIMI